VVGLLHAREDAAFLEGQLEAVDERGAQRLRTLEEQLRTLRERYRGLVGHRATELSALHEDVASLQRGARECEHLAARCLARGAGRSGGGRATCGRRDGTAGAEELPKLSSAVARLRRVLELCEAALAEEELRHRPMRLQPPRGGPDSGSDKGVEVQAQNSAAEAA